MKHKSDTSRIACEGEGHQEMECGIQTSLGACTDIQAPGPFSPSLSGSLEVWSTLYSQEESSPNFSKINVTLLQMREREKKKEHTIASQGKPLLTS